MAKAKGSQTQIDNSIDLEEAEKAADAIAEIASHMKNGMTPQEATGLDPKYLEGLYAQAYHLYNTGKYIDAAQIFRSLVLMRSTEFKYLLGLAACHHLLKEYENAIKVYTACSLINPQDPLSYYHLSDCHLQLKEYLAAYLCLKMTLKTAGDHPEFAKIKERSLLKLQSLVICLFMDPLV